MRVARAEERHVSQIIDRWKELMDYHKGLDTYFARSPEGHISFERHVRECIVSTDHLVLVAVEEDRVLGYLLAHIIQRPTVFAESEFGEISDLAVMKEHTRKGIGERMFKVALKWFKSRGIERIEVRVSPNNHIAISFWRKHGFQDYFHAMYLKA